MNNISRPVTCLTTLTLAVILLATPVATAGAVKDFTLPSATDDSLIRLSDYSGKVILIHWWRTTCGWCQQETPKLLDLYEDHRDDGLVVIGVSDDTADSVDQVRAFVQRHDINYPVGLMDQGEFRREIFPLADGATPGNYIVSRDGEIEFLGLMRNPDEDWQKIEKAVDRRLDEPKPAEAAIESRQLKPAPSFTLTDLQGNERSLKDFRGRPLIVNFFTNNSGDWAGSVFSKLHEDYAERGLQVVGIHLFGDEKGIRDYVKRHDVSHAILKGTRETQQDWIGDNKGWATFFVTPDGKMLKKIVHSIVNGIEETVFRKYAKHLLAGQSNQAASKPVDRPEPMAMKRRDTESPASAAGKPPADQPPASKPAPKRGPAVKSGKTGIELVGRSAEATPLDAWRVYDAGSPDDPVVVARGEWGFKPLPPGDYYLSVKPQGYYARQVRWGDFKVEDGKTTVVRVDSGVDLVGRSADDKPPYGWKVIDVQTDEQVAYVYKRWGFTPLPPGKYEIRIEPGDAGQEEISWGEVVVDSGKATRVRVDCGVKLAGRSEDARPPKYWYIYQPGEDDYLTWLDSRWGFTPLPPGKYEVRIEPGKAGQEEISWGEVVVESGKTTTVRVDSGVKLAGRSDDELPPPKYWYIYQSGEEDYLTWLDGQWGLVPLPPGEYRVSVKPRGSYAKQITWAEIEVQEGEITALRVDSGVELAPSSKNDEALKEWKVFDAQTDDQVAYVYQRWGATPLPPGEYYVEAPFPGVEAATAAFTLDEAEVKRLTPADFGIARLIVDLPAAHGVRLVSGSTEMEVMVSGSGGTGESHRVFKGPVTAKRIDRWAPVAGDVSLRIASGEMAIETSATLAAGEATEIPFEAEKLAKENGLSLFQVTWPAQDPDSATSRVIVMDSSEQKLLGLQENPPAEAKWISPPQPTVRLQHRQEEMVHRDVPMGELTALDFEPPEQVETRQGVQVDIAIQSPDEGQLIQDDRVTVSGQASTEGPAGATRIALVLDSSGSAADSSGADLDGDGGEESILQAEAAACRKLLKALHKVELDKVGTNFEVAIVRFSSDSETVVPLTKLSNPSAIEKLNDALDQVEQEGAGGDTNFHDALDEASKAFRAGKRSAPAVVVFLTDGEPTRPEQPAQAGLDAAARVGLQGATIHAVGLGKDFPHKHTGLATFPPKPKSAIEVLAQLAVAGAGGSTMDSLPQPADVVSLVPRLPVKEFPEAELKEVKIVNTTIKQPAIDVQLDKHGFFEAQTPVSLLPQGEHAANTLRATAIAKDGSQATDIVRVRGQRPSQPATSSPSAERPPAGPSADDAPKARLSVTYQNGERFLPPARMPAVELILDSSHSMNEEVDGQAKHRIARKVVDDVLGELSPNIQLGLRLFGHWGPWLLRKTDRDAEALPLDDPRLNTDSELVVRIDPLTAQQRRSIKQWLDWAKPRGSTPLVYSLLQAKNDFPTNLQAPKTIVLVSDGKETAGGELADVAAAYRGSDIGAVIHVVGFDIQDTEAERQLRQIADMGGGNYYVAQDAGELTKALRSAVQNLGFVVLDETGEETIARGSVNEAPVPLAPGRYRVRLAGGETKSLPVLLDPSQELELKLDERGRLQRPDKPGNERP